MVKKPKNKNKKNRRVDKSIASQDLLALYGPLAYVNASPRNIKNPIGSEPSHQQTSDQQEEYLPTIYETPEPEYMEDQ